MSDTSSIVEPSEFDTDSGSDFHPPSDNESESDSGESTIIAPDVNVVDEKKGRKRKIKHEGWKRQKSKVARNSGKSYLSFSGNVVPEKTFFDGNCICSRRCHLLLSIQERKRIFENFYNLSNFNLQTSYINGQVTVTNKGRFTHSQDPNKRSKTRIYKLQKETGDNVSVCKFFFKNALRVSDGRLTRALINKTRGGEQTTPPIDRRGKHPPKNKTNQVDIDNVKHFVNKFAKYKSHYSRVKNPHREYLSPDLNISKLYNLYLQSDEFEQKVSRFVFTKIFNEEFNLHFRYPATDTCKKCDSMNVKIESLTGEDKRKVEIEKELHLRMADAARSGMREDPKEDPNSTTTIAFDLMKTLPTPNISTGVAYYKRQLWTYCLGIHNLSTNQAHMYVWHEGMASRGPQEIGSCIMHYVKNYVQTPNLIMYSDQCGGQNRNIKMAAICTYMTYSDNFSPKVISHKFLVSGHSYLPCDQDFGMIEKQKRYFKDIFLPDDWIKVILSAKKTNKFEVVKMRNEDFKSTVNLEKLLTNRKKGEENVKVEWLKIQWLKFKCDEPFNIYFKYSNNDAALFYNVNVTKKRTELQQMKHDAFQLDVLYPTGRPIEKLKYKDLQGLLCYIPPIAHEFYTSLSTTENAVDEDIGTQDQDVEAQVS